MNLLDRLEKSVDDCAECLERLNKQFPHLASENSTSGVEHWRQRRIRSNIHDMSEAPAEPVMPADGGKALALELLQSHGLEDVLDILRDEHRIDLTLPQLIHLVGKQAYRGSLGRDAQELMRNAISYEQIASLWNELDRPALGSARWNARSVSMLVE